MHVCIELPTLDRRIVTGLCTKGLNELVEVEHDFRMPDSSSRK
jgi:hypothetical protein